MNDKQKTLDWEVQKYGVLKDIYDVIIDTRFITQKVYKYQGKLFVETWCDGVRVAFAEIFD